MTKCFEIEKVYTFDLLIAQVKHGICLTLCYDFFVRDLLASHILSTRNIQYISVEDLHFRSYVSCTNFNLLCSLKLGCASEMLK